MRPFLLLAAFAVGSFMIGDAAYAQTHDINQRERCEDELYQRPETSWVGITKELAIERHLWAKRCIPGFTDQAIEIANSLGMVWSFTNNREAGRVAPWNRDAPCDDYKIFTMCPLGCFAADQRVLFDSAWMTLDEAKRAGVETFSSLDRTSSPFKMTTSVGNKILYIASGEEKQALISISLKDGKAVRVTQEHPMIDQSGTIVPAKLIQTGMMLLTVDGPRQVVSVEQARDVRKVWHLFPESTLPQDNVVFAEGIATGSLRFQNVWADEASRLLLRNELSPAFIEELSD